MIRVAALLASFALVAQTALAQPADDLGTIGGWTLLRSGDAAHPESCTAQIAFDGERGLRVDARPETTAIGFVSPGSALAQEPIRVAVWFNGERDEARMLFMALEIDATGTPWRSYRRSNAEPEGILDLFANAETMHVAYNAQGLQEIAFSLRGSNRALLGALACALPGSFETPPVAPEPPAGASRVIIGRCSLVVDGQTYVERRGDCPIWMAGDGSGAFWINTDRDSYLGEYFAEIVPAGDGTAQGHWTAERGATHAQAFLGEDFRLQGGGCWVGARARVCAMR